MKIFLEHCFSRKTYFTVENCPVKVILPGQSYALLPNLSLCEIKGHKKKHFRQVALLKNSLLKMYVHVQYIHVRRGFQQWQPVGNLQSNALKLNRFKD